MKTKLINFIKYLVLVLGYTGLLLGSIIIKIYATKEFIFIVGLIVITIFGFLFVRLERYKKKVKQLNGMKFGLLVLIAGGCLNLFVVAVNDFQMPVITNEPLRFTQTDYHSFNNSGNFLFLADWIDLKIFMISIGDILAIFGDFIILCYYLIFIFGIRKKRRVERCLAERRNS